MAIEIHKPVELCERLISLGYSRSKRIRMYGEEFELISNPIPHENGLEIEAISRKSGARRRLRIPLSVLHMITRDLFRETIIDKAA